MRFKCGRVSLSVESGVFVGPFTSLRLPRAYRSHALHNIRVRYPLSAVGAVYDRAFGPLACESCAVIDRAYSKNDDVTSRCAKPLRREMERRAPCVAFVRSSRRCRRDPGRSPSQSPRRPTSAAFSPSRTPSRQSDHPGTSARISGVVSPS